MKLLVPLNCQLATDRLFCRNNFFSIRFLTLSIIVQVIDRVEFEGEAKPLGKERFAGAIDTCGGKILANVLPQIKVLSTASVFCK
jgi:hypothetical protein